MHKLGNDLINIDGQPSNKTILNSIFNDVHSSQGLFKFQHNLKV